MPVNGQSFDWDELLMYIADRRVIPVIGKDLLLVQINGTEQSLENYLAGRLANVLNVPAEGLPQNFGLNEVALRHLGNGGKRSKIYASIKTIMDGEEFQIPKSLSKLAQITDFKLFISTTFDPLLHQAVNQARFPGRIRP